jgi:hypothetical protein
MTDARGLTAEELQQEEVEKYLTEFAPDGPFLLEAQFILRNPEGEYRRVTIPCQEGRVPTREDFEAGVTRLLKWLKPGWRFATRHEFTTKCFGEEITPLGPNLFTLPLDILSGSA